MWVLQGQKLWTSWAHHAARCVVLARTEGPGTGSRGISAFFVDMDSPGVSVRPLDTMAGVDEFCETFFDEVRVPARPVARCSGSRVAGRPAHSWPANVDRSSGSGPAGSSITSARSPAWPTPSTLWRSALIGSGLRRGVRAAGPLTIHPTTGRCGRPAGRPSPRSTRSSSLRPIRPSSTRPATCFPAWSSSTTHPWPTATARNGPTRVPRRSTAAPARSKGHRGVAPAEPAQGAPDGRRRDRNCSPRQCSAGRIRHRSGNSLPPWTNSGGSTCSPPIRRRRCPHCSRTGTDGAVVVGAPRCAGLRCGDFSASTATPASSCPDREALDARDVARRRGDVTASSSSHATRPAKLVVALGRSVDGERLVIAIEPEDLRVERRHGLDPGRAFATCRGRPDG